mmetsp:Transcript_16033/g.30225  ORF Transcript_16033/g.30225 Transcript_16033/m.30225 type:complete len:285 (+) Transcript_16033:24-878(+)
MGRDLEDGCSAMSRIDKLKCDLHDASAREQQCMLAFSLTQQAFRRREGKHRHGHQWDELSWRGRIVKFLHLKPVHELISGLIVLDALLVMVTLQLQMEVFALESLSYSECLEAMFRNVSAMDPTCVVGHPKHELAEELEHVEHILGYISIGILCIFLVENTLLMAAFGRNFTKVFFYPLDLVVVILSLVSEVMSFYVASDPRLEAAEERLERGTLKNRGSITKDLGGAIHLVGAIIFARFWRFFRVGHAVYFIATEEESERRLDIAEQAGEKDRSEIPGPLGSL